MEKILIKPNFLPSDTCNRFVSFLNESQDWEKAKDPVWDSRSINLRSMTEPMREEMLDLRVKVKQELLNFFKVTKPVYADIFQFVRWRRGDMLHPHADAENPDGSPHPFFFRKFAAIIYLNNNYVGGRTYFPNFNNYTPENNPGTLVIFPGNLEHLHGVTQVTDGMRYTIASFFTYDRSRQDMFRI
jgi:predicted 2-oxoglutarate/Fe(II)-dependent dioxygenase YbiX